METLQAIAKRKSTRNYLPKQIPEKDLKTILFAGCAAPVAGDDWDTIQIIVIQNGDLLSRMSRAGASRLPKRVSDPFYGAPTLILIATQIHCPYPFHAGQANTACIGENMCIAATDLGLGSTYLTGFLPGFCEDESLVKGAGVADGFAPSAGVLIGYPKIEDDSEKVGIRTNIVHYIR